MVVTVSDIFGPEVIVLNGSAKGFWDNASPAGAVTVATLSAQSLTVTNPAFISTKTFVEGSPVVFANAPVQKGSKTGTLPPAAPPKTNITVV